MNIIWLLWFVEDWSAKYPGLNLVGVFSSDEKAKDFAGTECLKKYFGSGPRRGGAEMWVSTGFMDATAKDSLMGAWILQGTGLNSVVVEPEISPSRKVILKAL